MKKMWSTEAAIRAEIESECQRTTQKQTATRLGFSDAFICNVRKGRRDITTALAAAMGYQRITVFQKVKSS